MKNICVILLGLLLFIMTACIKTSSQNTLLESTNTAAVQISEEPLETTKSESVTDSDDIERSEILTTDDAQVTSDPEIIDNVEDNIPTDNNNILIAYFTIPENVSLDGADAISGASILMRDGQIYGNMEYLAQLIANKTGGTLFKIETVQEYPLDHSPLINFAKEEQNAGARPELKTELTNLEKYNTVFIGYPIWWADIPQPLYTFLETYEFGGKTIVVFSSHGGSRLANTLRTIKELQPHAAVLENALTIDRNRVVNFSQEEMNDWIDSLGL